MSTKNEFCSNNKKPKNHFGVLWKHLYCVVWGSFKNIRVISFVLVSVAFVGGAGIWMPWLKESEIDSWLPGSTVFTYCFALLGSIICNRLYFYTKSIRDFRSMYEEGNDDLIRDYFTNQDTASVLSAWGMLFGTIIIILISIAYANHYDSDSWIGWLGLVLSILLYLIASAEDLDKKSSVFPKSKDSEDAGPVVPAISDNLEAHLDGSFFQDGEETGND